MTPRLNLLALLVLLSSLWMLPAAAQTEPLPDVTPEQARQTLEALQDDELRDEVVRTLEVIVGEVTGEALAEASDEAPPQTSAEEESPLVVLVPLEEGGLVARTLDQVDEWLDGLRTQLLRIGQALAEFPAWVHTVLLTADGRLLLGQTVVDLGIVFGIGLCLEWGLRRLLRRTARSLVRSARQADSRRPKPAVTPGDDDLDPVALAALRPMEDCTALVQTERDGVEYVEAVPVPPYGRAGDSPRAVTEGELSQPSPLQTKPVPVPVETEVRALRRLPFALTHFVLDLLPLGLFFGIAALVLQLLPGLDPRTHMVTREVIYAYVITRVVMAVVRLLVSPKDASLRIVQVSDTAAGHIHHGLQRLVVLATFGVALGHALRLLGSGLEVELVVIKATSLLVHLSLLMLIFRFRDPIGEWIAGPAEGSGTVHALRHWLAEAWPLLAGALVLGTWVVWALGIEDGFTRLLEFIGISAAIIVLGRLAAVLALGALGRLAGINDQDEPAAVTDNSFRNRLVARYYPLLRWLMSLAVTAVTLLALLEAWGLDAVQWFAPGSIGGSLAAALATILVAVILALVVWQAANAAMEKRVACWRKEGDLLRAARLNTLLPMLRSALFIAIALVIGLTTLSQIGISTAPLIAGAGIIGVALGFGSQKLVQDFINGIFLLMENAMQVGDSVSVAGISGTVENLSIRTVRLRASDGTLHIIPFSSVATVSNSHRGIGNAAVRVSVSYDTDINFAISELRAIGAELRTDPVFAPNILANMEVWGVDAMDGSMITLAGQMRCIDKARSGVQREINRRIIERFRARGIMVADPRERPLVTPEGGGTLQQ